MNVFNAPHLSQATTAKYVRLHPPRWMLASDGCIPDFLNSSIGGGKSLSVTTFHAWAQERPNSTSQSSFIMSLVLCSSNAGSYYFFFLARYSRCRTASPQAREQNFAHGFSGVNRFLHLLLEQITE